MEAIQTIVLLNYNTFFGVVKKHMLKLEVSGSIPIWGGYPFFFSLNTFSAQFPKTGLFSYKPHYDKNLWKNLQISGFKTPIFFRSNSVFCFINNIKLVNLSCYHYLLFRIAAGCRPRLVLKPYSKKALTGIPQVSKVCHIDSAGQSFGPANYPMNLRVNPNDKITRLTSKFHPQPKGCCRIRTRTPSICSTQYMEAINHSSTAIA